MARIGWAALGLLLAASCNSILGLDEVRPASSDASSMAGAGGAVSTGSGGKAGLGGAPGGLGGSGGAVGAGGAGASGGAGGRSCGRELLLNGNFDQGPTVWSDNPLNEFIVRRDDDPDVSAAQVVPHSPRYVARMGGTRRFAFNWTDQEVAIPSDATELTVSGYVLVRTDEQPQGMIDKARAELNPESPQRLSFGSWSNLDATGDWMRFSKVVNVAALAGMVTAFRFTAENDETVATFFFFDTVSLTVSGCGP